MKDKQPRGRMECYLITTDFFSPKVSILSTDPCVNTDREVFNLEPVSLIIKIKIKEQSCSSWNWIFASAQLCGVVVV